MTMLYWALEYLKVVGAYFFLMFLFPSILFRGFLKGRSLTFRFGFCTTVSVILLNTVVLLLGLVHCLHPWVVRILFYGPLAYLVIKRIPGKRKALKQLLRVLSGTYGPRQLLLVVCKTGKEAGSRMWKRLRLKLQGSFWEYGLLFVVVLYGCIYFTYGAFQDYSFGFGDMYPHNAWIYGLTQGQIFSAGVYPEGMHCFIYAMHTLFGIRIYSCMLFTAGIHAAVLLVSAYLLLKEIFRFRYTPMFAIALFLMLDVVCINGVYGMSRLQWTIPQEFGMYTVLLCPAFLLRYLKSEKQTVSLPENKWGRRLRWIQKLYYNENLLVFILALAVSLAVHFYPTIMAFFLCVAFVPVSLAKIVKPDRFFALLGAVLAGVFIAVLPMAGALASGIPFQGSIGWAMDVINGTEGADSGNVIVDEDTGEEITGDIFSNFGNSQKTEQTEQTGEPSDTVAESAEESREPAEPFLTRLKAFILTKAEILYKSGYVTLYKYDRANLFLLYTVIGFLLFLFGRLLFTLMKRRKNLFDHYLSLSLATIIFMMLYCAGDLGLPSLIASARLCSTIQLLLTAMCMIPVDAVCCLFAVILPKAVMKSVSLLITAGIYVVTNLTGTYHGYLYYELTRFNAAVMTTYQITETLPEYSYTIVSPVDELYQQIQYGFHEEAVNFVNECVGEDYTLPTEYVFLYVEKHPIQYAQSHFFAGPSWLALEKYTSMYNSYVSQCPDIYTATASPELAEPPFYQFPISSSAYSDLLSRTVIESRLQKWCQEFERLYPGELHIYYEDENFVCYYFKQNPACLYQLGIL